MRFAILLSGRYEQAEAQAVAAEENGYESAWVPDHLVLPSRLTEDESHTRQRDGRAEMTADMPFYDGFVQLAAIARATSRIRLGSWVYNLALRHPFITARAVTTLDHVSNGRVTLGIGAGWLEGEYRATGIDFATRGRRLEETLEIVRRLWSEKEVAFTGAFYAFEPVQFEPKPIQDRIPIHIGGDSTTALDRAARLGDGWVGSFHDTDTAAQAAAYIHQRLNVHRIDRPRFEITIGHTPSSPEDVERLHAAGVTRVIVKPWRRGSESADAITEYGNSVVRHFQ